MDDDDTKAKAAAWFHDEWMRVPMGMPAFISAQWGRLIERTDDRFGDGMGKYAAQEWDRRALERMKVPAPRRR